MRCEIAARTAEGCAHLLYHNMTTPNSNSYHKAWSMPRAGHEVFVEARVHAYLIGESRPRRLYCR